MLYPQRLSLPIGISDYKYFRGAFNTSLTKLIFDQSKMRTHLITHLSQKTIQTSHLVLIQIGKKETNKYKRKNILQL